MATISGVATTGRRGATATISGSGFGASQGSSALIFWPVYGAAVDVTPTSWADTQVVVDIPTDGDDADLGKNAFFAVSVTGDPISARTPSFVLLAEAAAAPTVYQPGTYVFTPPGTEAAGVAPVAAVLSGSANVSADLSIEGAYEDAYALLMDGDNDYVTFGNVHAFAETDQFTFSLWFKKDSFTTGRRTLLSKLCNGTNPRGYNLSLDDSGAVEWNLQSDTSDYIRFVADTPIQDDGDWHHLAVSYDGSSASAGMDVYVDGSPVIGTRTGTLVGPITDTCPMYLGGKAVGGITEPWRGLLDDVAVINKQLSALEVLEAFNVGMTFDLRTASFSANLRSFWLMGDGDTYPTILDWGPAAFNGTMMNTSGAAFRLDTPVDPTVSALSAMAGSASVTGTLTDASVFVDDYALRVGGIEEKVDCGNVLAFEYTQPFSVSVWFRRPSVPTEAKTLVSKADSVTRRGWELRLDSAGYPLFTLVNTFGEITNGMQILGDSAVPTDTGWHHLVGTYDGSGLNSGLALYVDGAPIAGTGGGTITGTMVGTGSLLLGAANYDATRTWWGRMDDPAIYNVELSSVDVTQVYNSGVPGDLDTLGTSSNLQGWWWMGDGDTLPTVLDHSGNGYDGTTTNMSQSFNRLADTPAAPETLYTDVYSTTFGTTAKYVQCNSSSTYSFEFNQPFTISAWFKVHAMIEGGPWVITAKQGDGPALRGYSLQLLATRQLYFELVNDAGTSNQIDITTTAAFGTSAWYHVVVTYDGSGRNSGLNIFVNGVGQGADRFNTLSGTAVTTADMRIGGRASTGLELGFPQQIDEVIYYNVALTEGMVAALRTSAVLPGAADVTGMDGLIGWWRMGDGDSHPDIYDHGPYLNHCTMFNMSSGDFVADVPPTLPA